MVDAAISRSYEWLSVLAIISSACALFLDLEPSKEMPELNEILFASFLVAITWFFFHNFCPAWRHSTLCGQRYFHETPFYTKGESEAMHLPAVATIPLEN